MTAAVVAMVLVAGGSFLYFSGFNPFGDPEPNYAQAPTQSAVMDFGGLSADMRLSGAPLTDSAEVTATGSHLVRFVGSRTSILTRVGNDDDQPSWSVSIPHVDVNAGDDAPIDEALTTDGGPDQGDTEEEKALRGTPVVCRTSSGAVQCGERTVSLADGSITFTDPNFDVDPDPASSGVPVDIGDDGKPIMQGGRAYKGLSFDAAAHLAKISDPQASEKGPWIMSDGRTLAAVDSEKVLWTQKLDPSAAEVTRLGDNRVAPSWVAVDGTVIIGAVDGVRGIDIASGDQRWAVTAETDGFMVVGSELKIQHDGKVSTFDFTDSSKDQSVAANKNFDSSIPILPAPKLPSKDDIRNATVAVPPGCAEFAVSKEPKQAFTNGKTEEGEYGESITMRSITPSTATPKPLVAIEFVCYSGGNWVPNSVGVYDQNLELVTPIEPWTDDAEVNQQADFSRSMFTTVDMTGPYMTVGLDNIAVYGDEDFNAAERTGAAELQYAWAKDGYEQKDSLFNAKGQITRVPKEKEVQKFVDAASKGDDKTAGTMATDEVMKGLNQIIGDESADEPLTYRNLALQDGTEVDTCELIGVVSGEFGDYTMRNGMELMEGIGYNSDVKAGDVICGLALEGQTIDPSAVDNWYVAHLLLRGNETGAVQVYTVSAYTG